MAILTSLRKADAIVFQVLRRDMANPESDWNEFKVVPLAVKPSALRYQYSDRSAETQTVPERGFVDRYGRALTMVTMFGTFGIQPRRAGLIPKDGFTRLVEFRDEVFKLSQQARKRDEDGTAEYIYAVNYYDFINNERFAVNLKSFSPDWNARRSTIEAAYQLSFLELGPVIEAETRDPLLRVLLAFDELLERGLSRIEQANDIIRNAPVAGDVINVIEGYLAFVDRTGDLVENIAILSMMYRSALAGQRLDRRITSGARRIESAGSSIFSSIKG